MKSLEFEATQDETISDKIACLDRKIGQYMSDYGWLRDGSAQLSVCRRILSHSYVFGFFALGPTSIFADEVTESQDMINRNLFEMKQSELEQSVENLSKQIELPLAQMIEPGAINIIKQKVLDLTVNMDLRTLHLCETVQNDILGKLSCSQGIAPYHPSTQVVQCMQLRQKSSSFRPPFGRSKRPRPDNTQLQMHGHLA